MGKWKTNEKEYLLSVSKCTLPKDNPFSIHTEDNKEMYVIAPSSATFLNELDAISQYRTLYDTVVDLTTKISFSLECAIEDTYSEEILKQFNIMHIGSQKEWNAYYNIENALFRIEALWDILAQIYNIKYSLEDDIKKVYHNRIFPKQTRWIEKYWSTGVPSEVAAISEYLVEEDNTEISDGMWKGNYRYVNSLRNDMTHRLSISTNAFSSYAFTLREHPAFIIKRVAECFLVLQGYIHEACENILKESLHCKSTE